MNTHFCQQKKNIHTTSLFKRGTPLQNIENPRTISNNGRFKFNNALL